MKTVATLFRNLCLAAVAVMLITGASQAAEFERNIMTGGPTGTYIRIGQDIAGLGAQCGLTLNVVESAGSHLKNLPWFRKPAAITQFASSQSDLLEYHEDFEAMTRRSRKCGCAASRSMFPL